MSDTIDDGDRTRLHITSFYGGRERGRCLQIENKVLEAHNVTALADVIKTWMGGNHGDASRDAVILTEISKELDSIAEKTGNTEHAEKLRIISGRLFVLALPTF